MATGRAENIGPRREDGRAPEGGGDASPRETGLAHSATLATDRWAEIRRENEQVRVRPTKTPSR